MWRPFFLLSLCAVLVSCGGENSRVVSDIQAPVRVPSVVEYESQISGRVLSNTLSNPSGVALNSLGELYIADTDNHRILHFDRSVQPIREYGTYGNSEGRFQYPSDLVVERGLNLYVLDSKNRRVVQLDAALNYIDEIPVVDDTNEIISTISELTGVQVSSIGEITVADFDNSRLIRLNNAYEFSRYIGDFSYGRGALFNPTDIAIDNKGRLYVADAGNSRIAVYDDFGNYLFAISSPDMYFPSAVTVSPYGLLWVADGESATITAYSRDGKKLYQFGAKGHGDFEFSRIEGLAVSRDGRLFVADSGNNRIVQYRIRYGEAN